MLVLSVVAAQAFTIASYNVENYTLADRMAEGVHRTAYPKPESEKAALRRVLKDLDADLLALQEVGPQSFLDELQRDLQHAGLSYPYAVLLDAADPDRHVAILSRVPFAVVRRHGALPFKLAGKSELVKRGVLEVSVNAPGGEVTVFVVHLKSRRTERADDPEGMEQRRREAVAVRNLVLARFPEPARARFVLCGDWNDTPGSRAVRALTRRGRTEICQVLPATDSRGETWTHRYGREHTYSCLDYVAVSAGLLPDVENGRASVHDGPGTRHASDHRPVLLRLRAPRNPPNR